MKKTLHSEVRSDHARAVLFLCERLTAEGHTVISANTDEKADPQIFAQSDSGELAFYFVREGKATPPEDELARFRALAARHRVAAYLAPVTLSPSPHCEGVRPL
ncbi:MAG: hypothetical protein RBT78_00095 [Kiritimatiellia bacterium]|nr:hypothetical protein [Kiritimatiellia bacterium]